MCNFDQMLNLYLGVFIVMQCTIFATILKKKPLTIAL